MSKARSKVSETAPLPPSRPLTAFFKYRMSVYQKVQA
jgi:hypothetical protein